MDDRQTATLLDLAKARPPPPPAVVRSFRSGRSSPGTPGNTAGRVVCRREGLCSWPTVRRQCPAGRPDWTLETRPWRRADGRSTNSDPVGPGQGLTATLLDLAKVLDSPTLREPLPEGLPTALWLIRQSPKARALYEQLHRDTGDGPTLMELAKLLSSFSESPHPECQHTALWLVGQCETARQGLEELEQLAKDAGVLAFADRGSLVDVLQRHLEVDQLLAVSDWTDPMDVVDPGRERILPFYAEWISILSVRLGRSQEEEARKRLREVLGKLRQAARSPVPGSLPPRF
jgi:hypothetical protein